MSRPKPRSPRPSPRCHPAVADSAIGPRPESWVSPSSDSSSPSSGSRAPARCRPSSSRGWPTTATRRTRRTGRASTTRAPGRPFGIRRMRAGWLARPRRPAQRRGSPSTAPAIAWVGPVGPTRGKAKVYVDGQLIKTVDTHATHYAPTKVLFKTTFPKLGQHTLRIVVQGTRGPPDSRHRRVRGPRGPQARGEALAKRVKPRPTPTSRPGSTPAATPASTPAASRSRLRSRHPSRRQRTPQRRPSPISLPTT